MLSESVDQKAIMPISEMGKIAQNSGPQPRVPDSWTIGPRPPAWATIQTMRPRKTMIRNGAAQPSNRLIASMPHRMIMMLRAQKTAKLSHSVQGCAAASPIPIEMVPAVAQKESGPNSAATTANSAVPPIHVWMPNQPQATKARISAGRLAPYVPNDARAMTGYGIPYLVPAWLIASIGTRTSTFARKIVNSAWYQAIPSSIRPEASSHVGMLIAMPIHSDR
jgi:hypothetical protein